MAPIQSYSYEKYVGLHEGVRCGITVISNLIITIIIIIIIIIIILKLLP